MRPLDLQAFAIGHNKSRSQSFHAEHEELAFDFSKQTSVGTIILRNDDRETRCLGGFPVTVYVLLGKTAGNEKLNHRRKVYRTRKGA